MAIKLITPAASLAVSLVEAKAHLRVTVADEDALITALITSATEMAEQRTGRAVMPQTWELTLDAFPEAFELTRTPVSSITSLQYVNTAGTTQTLNSSLYVLDGADEFDSAYVVPTYGTTWPDTRDQINAVVLRFVAGYANAAAVPEPIKQWIKLMVSAMFENRSAVDENQTYSLGFADRLLDRYKVFKF